MQINVRSHSTLASVSSTVSCFPHKLQYPIKTARKGPLSLIWWRMAVQFSRGYKSELDGPGLTDF